MTDRMVEFDFGENKRNLMTLCAEVKINLSKYAAAKHLEVRNECYLPCSGNIPPALWISTFFHPPLYKSWKIYYNDVAAKLLC